VVIAGPRYLTLEHLFACQMAAHIRIAHHQICPTSDAENQHVLFMFRYPTNRRREVTLRHLRGETAVSLSRGTGISERHIRRWKRIAVLAIEERMRKPLTENPTAL